MTKKVFLTGASSGIGLAIAEALVARGHGNVLPERRERKSCLQGESC